MKPEHHKIATFYNNTYYQQGTLHPPSRHLQNLAEKLAVQTGQAVLDIACGKGEWLAALAAHGAQPHGIDISEKAIAVCRRRFPEADFRVGVAEQLPYAENAFDLVTCLGSLEHFLDQPAALQEMLRVAKPGARFLLLVPNAGFLPYRLGLYKGTQQAAVRETVRPLAEWEAMFHEAGLVVEQRWKDLHVLNRHWLFRKPWWLVPLRMLQALNLPLWPLAWQYQVYYLCQRV